MWHNLKWFVSNKDKWLVRDSTSLLSVCSVNYYFHSGQQLDCFGLAFAVIAACQVLKYSDVHLVASGDHAWAVCGEEYQVWVLRQIESVRFTTLMILQLSGSG